MTQVLFLLGLALLYVQAVKFCPKEEDGNKCRAKQSTFVCGVFFKGLSSNVPLAWLEAMPDAVVRARKDGATDEDIVELLGDNLDRTSYENYECGDKGANASCYAQMQNVRNEDFGSCGKSLLRKKCTDEADETMGDFLCGQCGEDWKQVESLAKEPLKHEEPLCCTKQGRFRKCDGSEFEDTCEWPGLD